MRLHEKYELQVAVHNSEREIAVPAVDISSGRPVLVHLLAGGYNIENQALLKSIVALQPEDRQHILEAGDHDGIPFIVTDTLPGNASLRNWIAAVAPPPAAQPGIKTERLARSGAWKMPAAQPPDAPPPPPAPAEDDEFSRLFGSAVKPEPAPTATPAAEPGEFT
ncbi:MAG TPA: hypothetical protein VG672_04420, partial [Bryobacteraceae bacterium]|nr:hypothetical protein [Bryobacteraceae bacterium]